MQPLNESWSRLKALFKRLAAIKETRHPKETGNQELIVRDLRPKGDPVGGASKGPEAKPDQKRPREIDFMNPGAG